MESKLEVLSAEEYERYSRQLILPEVGIEKQKILKNSKVLIVGVGGLGCPISLYLSAAGVGVLGLVESDRIALSNLHRQVLYDTACVGHSKLEVAKNKLNALNPHVKITLHETNLSVENVEIILGKYDVIVDATDNFSTRYLLNDYCILMNKILVYGSISQFQGLISVVKPHQGPCYRCIFPKAPPPEALPSCTEGGVLGSIPAVIASLQATEVLKCLLSVGEVLCGRLLTYDALGARFKDIKVVKDSQCVACGEPLLDIGNLQKDYALPICSILANSLSEISPEELDLERCKQNNIHLLDVRTASEVNLKNIEGSVHIPFAELSQRVDEIPRDRKIILYCKSGIRSAKAMAILKEFGFARVWHLRGGFDSYMNYCKTLDNCSEIE